jgi:hypothetical protein
MILRNSNLVGYLPSGGRRKLLGAAIGLGYVPRAATQRQLYEPAGERVRG